MQHFWYKVKGIIRSRTGMFWFLCFPIFLGAVFNLVFPNLADEEQYAEIPVGIVVEEENEELRNVLEEITISKQQHMFKIKEYDAKKLAEEALKKEEIRGYIRINGQDIHLTVKNSDIYATIVKSVLDQYKQNSVLIEAVMREHPERVERLVQEIFADNVVEIREISLKGQDKDPYSQYFYAALAMAALFASMAGLANGMEIQADLSSLGARRNVAPTKKGQQVVIDFLATFFIYCILMTIVVLVYHILFKRDFGDNLLFVLGAVWVGSFNGIAAGEMIAVMVKGSKQKKDGMVTAYFMLSSFLAGLQWGNITYLLEKHCPVVNRINPATLLVNAIKSMAVFGDYRQYAINLVSLFLIGVLFLVISMLKLRRTRYASL